MDPRLQIQLTTRINLLQSEPIRNTVTIRVDSNIEHFVSDSTGQTLVDTNQYSPSHQRTFNLISTNRHQIYMTIRCYQLDHQLSMFLASYIAPIATNNGLGIYSYDIYVILTFTYTRVHDYSTLLRADGVVERLVREGLVNEEISRSLDLESELCSICFENLLGTVDKSPTRMSCSHVFHDHCISQWLDRRNSCPLCRQLLYGR